MVCSVKASWQGSLKSPSPPSVPAIPCFAYPISHFVLIRRQRREHRVFGMLLQMVPGLEQRLMEGSGDDVVVIAELVSLGQCIYFRTLTLLPGSKGRF